MDWSFFVKTSWAVCALGLGACDTFDGTGGTGGVASTGTGDSTGSGPSGSTGSKGTGSGTPTGSSVDGSGSGPTSGTGGTAPTMETITVVDPGGAGIANARVVVNDAAGTVVRDEIAGADGSLVTDVPDGGSVSYIPPADAEGDRWMYVVFDIPAGGNVRILARDTNAVPSNPHALVTYNVAVQSPPGGTLGYQAFVSCRSTAFTTSQSMFSVPGNQGCTGIDVVSLLLVAYGGDEHAIAYGLNPGIPLPATGSTSQVVQVAQTTFEAKAWNIAGSPVSGPSYRMRVVGFDDAVASLSAQPLFDFEDTVATTPSFSTFVDIPSALDRGWVEETIMLAPDNPFVERKRLVALPTLATVVDDWDASGPSTASTASLFDFADLDDVKVRFDAPAPLGDVFYLHVEQAIDASTKRNIVLLAPAANANRSFPRVPGDVEDLYPTFIATRNTYIHADMTGADGYAATVAQGVVFDRTMSYRGDSQRYDFTP